MSPTLGSKPARAWFTCSSAWAAASRLSSTLLFTPSAEAIACSKVSAIGAAAFAAPSPLTANQKNTKKRGETLGMGINAVCNCGPDA